MDTIFSSQLQRLRKEHNVTQETLAAHLGVSPQAVSKWENGSYPDGDLLPKIADFFSVSTDYLYGRAKENSSVVQQIIDEMQKSMFDTEGSTKNFIDYVLRYTWAFQLSSWKNNKTYYDRPKIGEESSVTVSETVDNTGFTYMRLNKDLEYFFAVKQPEEGFAKRLNATDDMTELFAFLGDKINLKILQYMLTLKPREAVRPRSVAKLLGIPAERAENALNFLCKFDGMFTKGSVIDEDNKSENMYLSSNLKTLAPIMLMICAEMMINSPCMYQNQVGWCDKAWFKREDLSFLKQNKEADLNKKHYSIEGGK